MSTVQDANRGAEAATFDQLIDRLPDGVVVTSFPADGAAPERLTVNATKLWLYQALNIEAHFE
jgi:hypothetical protein